MEVGARQTERADSTDKIADVIDVITKTKFMIAQYLQRFGSKIRLCISVSNSHCRQDRLRQASPH